MREQRHVAEGELRIKQGDQGHESDKGRDYPCRHHADDTDQRRERRGEDARASV